MATPAEINNRDELISEKELTECDRIPLHLIGQIQSDVGHVLFFNSATGEVVAHDAKLHKLNWIAAGASNNGVTTEYTGMLLSTLVPPHLLTRIDELVEEMKEAHSTRSFHFYTDTDGSMYAISLSNIEGNYSVIGMEIEENPEAASQNLSTSLLHISHVIEMYEHETIVSKACDSLFNMFKKYDRGMVYRFNSDLSGEIIHEIIGDQTKIKSSYMGLRYPASDIPQSARLLYKKNSIRYIHNVESTSVDIVGNQDINLSQIRMRAAAKPHILYLRNMGVKSSLSLAIVVDGELWGICVFHCYTEVYRPPLQLRIACETIGSMLSVRVESSIRKAQGARVMALSEHMLNFHQNRSVIQNLYEWGEEGLLTILDVDVLVVNVQNSREGEGDSLVLGNKALVPSAKFWEKLSMHPNRELCLASTREGVKSLNLTLEDCPATGILFFRQGRTQVMLGRGASSDDVTWAGNPDEEKLKIGGILHPRNSFAKYIQKAKLEARGWSKQDINVCSAFRTSVCELSHNYMLYLLRNDVEEANQRYLSAVDRARDNYEFFAHMSHELRTPFHGVMGCLNILDETAEKMPPTEVKDIVTTAITSGNHMLNLLNDILDISKNKHLSHLSTQDEVIYQTLAFEAVDCLKSLAASHKVHLETDIQPKEDKILINADRTKTIQIVSNIVNNAIKFTKEGTIKVEFRLFERVGDAVDLFLKTSDAYDGKVFTIRQGEMMTSSDKIQQRVASFPNLPNQRWLFVSIQDTGCGMTPEDLVKMLEPYTQSSSGSNRAFQGTGLGLFICLSLCHQLCGFLGGASTFGQGTLFQLALPVELANDHKPGLPDEPVAESKPVFNERVESRIRMTGPIMIVDDNKVNLKILNRALLIELNKRDLEIEIINVSDGAEAIAIYKERRPSLCIIDYHMPGVDGVQATRAIRELEGETEIDPSHIFSYTADATEEAAQVLYEAGVNEMMTKPPAKGFIQNVVARLVLVASNPVGGAIPTPLGGATVNTTVGGIST